MCSGISPRVGRVKIRLAIPRQGRTVGPCLVSPRLSRVPSIFFLGLPLANESKAHCFDRITIRWWTGRAAKAGRPRVSRRCLHCGKPFEPVSRRHRYCGRTCSDAAYCAANRDKNAKRTAAYYAAHRGKIAKRKAAWYVANRARIARRKAAYRAANRDRIAAYYAANRERAAKYSAAYYAANREKIAAYRAAHRDRIAKYDAAYYAANRERILKHQAAYYAANRDSLKNLRTRKGGQE